MDRDDEAWIALAVELPATAVDLVTTVLVEEGAPGVLVDPPTAVPPRSGFVRLETHVPGSEGARIGAVLEAYLHALGEIIPEAMDLTVERAPVPGLDWEAAFRAHHRPTPIGTRLLVAPPWDVPESGGRIVIVVDPGMAFGTGQHPTTRGCLEEIESAVAAGAGSGLDVGTGSGILAVAMSRLGMRRVVATDVDSATLPLARRTCATNHATGIVLLTGHADAVRGHFDLVVANLLAAALVAEARSLAARVAPGGRLVVSGVLAEQVDEVVHAYPAWRVTNTRAEDPWRTLRLERCG